MGTEEIIQSQYQELCRVVEASKGATGTVAAMADLVVGALRAGGKVLCAGNGGSAADALHMAEELVGRYRGDRRSLPGISLAADATALTCIGNDYGFDAIFSRQVEGLGQPGDVFVGFSTSGNSANIIQAVEASRRLGLKVILLLGKDGGKLKGQADAEWIVPHTDTARIQEMHGWAMHGMLEVVEAAFPEAG
ncbi:MAG: SIS domain-containing protein [Verrucomicrobiota bacterium]